MLTKNALIDIIAEKCDTDKATAKKFIETLPSIIVDAVKEDGKVTIPDLGIISASLRSARDGRNPKTGETIKIPEKVVPKFTAAKFLKDQVEGAKVADKKAA